MKPVILMSAPNGARRNKSDHPMLPISAGEIAQSARTCFVAGAKVLHLHVRDDQGKHSLDPGRYREVMQEVSDKAKGMLIQITTESAGLYDVKAQIDCVKALHPASASLALRELAPDENPQSLALSHWMAEHGIHAQYILYSTDDLNRFRALIPKLPRQEHHVIFVLGAYNPPRLAEKSEVADMVVTSRDLDLNWSICAFGRHEFDCVIEAINLGGHGRVGFENNLLRKDGTRAFSNADIVGDIVRNISRPIATPEQIREIWSI